MMMMMTLVQHSEQFGNNLCVIANAAGEEGDQAVVENGEDGAEQVMFT